MMGVLGMPRHGVRVAMLVRRTLHDSSVTRKRLNGRREGSLTSSLEGFEQLGLLSRGSLLYQFLVSTHTTSISNNQRLEKGWWIGGKDDLQ